MKGLLYALITAVVFASFEPISKLIATDFSPLAICGIRFLIGGLMFLPYSLYEIRKQKIQLTITDHIKMVGLGILFICISMTMLQYAIKLSSSPALIAIIFSANSLITIILSAFTLNEKFTLKKILAIIVCSIGFIVCSWDNLMAKSEFIAIFLATMSALSFSIYTILNKKMMKKASGNILIGFSFIYGSIILLGVTFALGGKIVTTDVVTVNSILVLLYVGFIVTGLGYWTYFAALRQSATMASLSFLIKPALSPFIAIILNDVPVRYSMVLGLILVLGGSYFVLYSDKIINKKTK